MALLSSTSTDFRTYGLRKCKMVTRKKFRNAITNKSNSGRGTSSTLLGEANKADISESIGRVENGEYVVENILNFKIDDDGPKFYVKWWGWPDCFNSWEPETNMSGCREMIKLFMDENVNITANGDRESLEKLKEQNKLNESTYVSENNKEFDSFPNLSKPYMLELVNNEVRMLELEKIITSTDDDSPHVLLITTDLEGRISPKVIYGVAVGCDGQFVLADFDDSNLVELVGYSDMITAFPSIDWNQYISERPAL